MAEKNPSQNGGGVLLMEDGGGKRKQWNNARFTKEILIYFRSPDLSSIQIILEGLLTL